MRITGGFLTVLTGSEKLAQGGENALREVLDYCRKIGQEVILVASPYAYTQDDMGELNAVTTIAQEYNVPFLNANKDQEKLGIDFSTDYYDAHHRMQIRIRKSSELIFLRIIMMRIIPICLGP